MKTYSLMLLIRVAASLVIGILFGVLVSKQAGDSIGGLVGVIFLMIMLTSNFLINHVVESVEKD